MYQDKKETEQQARELEQDDGETGASSGAQVRSQIWLIVWNYREASVLKLVEKTYIRRSKILFTQSVSLFCFNPQTSSF